MTTNKAKQLLRDSSTTATGCFCAVDLLLSNSWRIYEPETIWLELEHLDIDVPVSNRAQIMAVRTLFNTDRFLYDANIFADVCHVLNNEELNYKAMEDVPVAQLAWGVYEAKSLISGLDSPSSFDLDREPVKYTAIQLFREGFVVAPDELSFAQAELSKFYPLENKDQHQKIKKAWAAVASEKTETTAYPETISGVQFAKLASVKAYVQHKDTQLKQELIQLQQ